MKSFLVFLFAVACTVSASAQWSFVKYFPNATQTFSANGINNGLVVDRDGKIWLQTQTTSDSVLDVNGGGFQKKFSEIFVYNADGSQASFSPIKIYKSADASINDTLGVSGYGLAVDADGNIISCDPSTRLYRINYKTGVTMTKVVSPIPGYSSSMVCPAVDAAGEVFVGPVVCGTGAGLAILNSDFSSAGTLVDANTTASGYARAIAVTANGNDVYFPTFSPQQTVHYHSDNGSLGPYTAVDTVLKGLCVETTVWDKNGNLWVTGGNITSGLPTDPNYTGYTWYAWNPTSKTIVDSINWHGDISADPRPRGIAFSATGDTAWVATFNANDSCVEMFKKGPSSVQRQPDVVVNSYSLSQNYPNPFNPSTQIKFTLAKSGLTTLKVYNILGEEVATLVNENLASGSYSATFDASRLASGTYLYILTSGNQRLMNKMMLLK